MMAGNQLEHVSEKWNRALSAGMKILAVTLSVAALGAAGTLPASAAAERSLAGIKIFSRAKLVLQRFGNPSEIIPGGTGILGSGSVGGGAGPGVPGGMGGGYPGGPGGGGLPGFGGGGAPGGAPGEFGGGGKMGGMGAPGMMGGGGAPGMMGGGGAPGMMGGGDEGGGGGMGASPMGGGKMGGMGGYPGGGPGMPGMGGPGAGGRGAAATAVAGQTTWIYDRPDGSSLEFTLSSDGRVVQIRATGYQAKVKTARGVALGMSYSQVLSKYGFPESQSLQGTILTANYSEKFHAGFQFYNNKLVGIVVAAVE